MSFKRWINALKLNDESKRQDILHELGTNGKLSDEGWQILIGAVVLNDTLNLELIQEWQGECNFPTCVHMTLLVTGVEYNLLPFNVTFENIQNSFFDKDGNGIEINNAFDFKTALEAGYDYDANGAIKKLGYKNVYIDDFEIDGNNITCLLYADANYGDLILRTTEVLQLGGFVNVSGLRTSTSAQYLSSAIYPFIEKMKKTIIYLELTDMGIVDFFDELPNLPNLTTLNLARNSITEFVDSYPNLKYLDLSQNNIGVFEPINENLEKITIVGSSLVVFGGQYKNLKELYISDNDLSGALLLTNENFPALTKAEIYANSLSSLSVDSLFNLQTLHVGQNKISDLTLTRLSNLNWADFSDNKLSEFNFVLPSINVLYLTGNQITNLVLDYPNLTEVYCLGASVSTLQINIDSKIKRLNLASNNIAEFAISGTLKMLTHLHLNGNDLTFFNPGLNFSNLTYLLLNGNNISDWTNTINVFRPDGFANLSGNAQSASGSNFANNLIDKNWSVEV